MDEATATAIHESWWLTILQALAAYDGVGDCPTEAEMDFALMGIVTLALVRGGMSMTEVRYSLTEREYEMTASYDHELEIIAVEITFDNGDAYAITNDQPEG